MMTVQRGMMGHMMEHVQAGKDLRAMTGRPMGGGMMGTAWTGRLGWMWIPAVLTVGLGALLAWDIFGKKAVTAGLPPHTCRVIV